MKVASSVEAPGVQCLGLYGVLGRFDFVCILDAPDNESAARYSLLLGMNAGASIETMPAVRIGLLGPIARSPRKSPNRCTKDATDAFPGVTWQSRR